MTQIDLEQFKGHTEGPMLAGPAWETANAAKREARIHQAAKEIIATEAVCIEWGAEASRSVELAEDRIRELILVLDEEREAELTKARQAIRDLREALEMVLSSASPNPRDHPTMTKAWPVGRAALASTKEYE